MVGWLKRLFLQKRSRDPEPANPEPVDSQLHEPGPLEPEPLEPEPMEMEITDVLDLHTFPPREVKALVRDYLDLAIESGFGQVRIIHGKGIGVQRNMVRSLLEKDPRVESFGDPPGESGGWGATWVRFHRVETGENGAEP